MKWLFGKEIEIPEEWNLEKLGNICKIRKNNNILSDLYIGLEHIGQGNNILEDTGNVNEFTSTKNTFFQGDVLYGKLRPLLNKVWLATESGYCSTDILPLVSTNKILSRILLFVLTNHDFLRYAVCTSAGTKMPRTNWSDMKKFSVILPSIQEQQKIASILSGVDATIESTQKVIEKAEKLKRGLMQRLLTNGIGHTKFRKMKWLFGKEIEIHTEWDYQELEKKKKITDGSHYSPTKVSNGFPLATVKNVKGNLIDIDSCYQISKENYEQLVKDGNQPNIGDVLFTKDGTVGKTIVFKQTNKIILLSSLAIIRKSVNLDSDYCNYALQSKFMTKHLAKYFGGTAIKRIILHHLSKYEFPIPQLPEQTKIASILSGVDAVRYHGIIALIILRIKLAIFLMLFVWICVVQILHVMEITLQLYD